MELFLSVIVLVAFIAAVVVSSSVKVGSYLFAQVSTRQFMMFNSLGVDPQTLLSQFTARR